MKYIAAIITILAIAVVALFFSNDTVSTRIDNVVPGSNSKTEISPDAPEVATVAEGLDTPWAIVFLPDGSTLISERQGTIRRINTTGQLETDPISEVPNVVEIGEGGLLGMTHHPDFESNQYIYFYYTYKNDGNSTLNRVVRAQYDGSAFGAEEIIVDAIPGANFHNGGELGFGPDGYLYITTGDAQEPSQAQNTSSLAGKILRVTDTGEAAPDNPFNNRIYSYGHRNPQGIDWDNDENLWSTEHGRSGALSGFDEINLIQAGGNYGWPEIQGDEELEGMISPIIHSGAATTWAPGSIVTINNEIYFSGLRGAAVYRGIIKNNQIDSVTAFYKEEFGRIREVMTGENELIYITTSNKDGRGNATPEDDRIIQINTTKL